MIYDGLSAIGRYRGIARGLDVLIDWLDEHDVAELPLGITQIDGERVFANVMDAKTKDLEDARFEVHRRYHDVQIDLAGAERFRTTPGAVEPIAEFDEGADKGYCQPALGNDDLLEGTLDHGRFAIFWVGEPHSPNLVLPGAEPGDIKKICFKVLADQFWEEVSAE